MKSGSTSIWSVIVLLLIVVVGGDRFLAMAAARRHAVQAAQREPLPAADWQKHDFKRLGMSVEIPAEPVSENVKLNATGKENVQCAEQYHGDADVLQYELGRCILKTKAEYSPELHFERVRDRIKSAPQVKDFKVVGISKIQWDGSPAFEMTCNFTQDGIATVLHHRLRLGKHDWTYCEGWYDFGSRASGERAWNRMVGSLAIQPASKS